MDPMLQLAKMLHIGNKYQVSREIMYSILQGLEDTNKSEVLVIQKPDQLPK